MASSGNGVKYVIDQIYDGVVVNGINEHLIKTNITENGINSSVILSQSGAKTPFFLVKLTIMTMVIKLPLN